MNEQDHNRGTAGTHALDKSFKDKPEGVVETIGGDELQTLKVTWSTKSNFPLAGDFWTNLEGILDDCDQIILEQGWDKKAGNDRDFPGERIAEAFSELWYAGQIGFLCWNLLVHHRERTLNEVALAKILKLGLLLAEFELREAFKPSIVTGTKNRRYLSGLRNEQNEKMKLEVKKRRSLVAELLKQTKLTGGARDKWLIKKLVKLGYREFCPRTIRKDVKAIQDHSAE